MKKFWLVIFILFLTDRLTKIYVIRQSSQAVSRDDFFSFQLNDRLAFSLPLPEWLMYPLLIVTIAILAFWLKQLIKEHSQLRWPAALVVVGAISNFLDRLSYGGVVDFIDLGFWPVFNLSDVCITIGVVWIIISELNQRNKKQAS